MDDNEKFMRMAINRAKEGVDKGQTPFAAVIVKNDEVIACEHNLVWENTDITAHGEIQAIRTACKKLNSIDLSGSVIYSTCEPCPMCFTAIHWARIDKIICGARIDDAASFGFNELSVSNEKMKTEGNSKVEIVSGFMCDENIELFKYWESKNNKKTY
ncbi:MAG: nucleoside deaminase [Ignavibacteriae bacterium]|nr:MAG: nucleoside deaminase [Ignavibacteriota bacterium]